MKRLLLTLLLLAISDSTFACENQPEKQSADEVVFNNITTQSMALDQKLQDMYECKYAFAMVFSSSAYESMHLISGSLPPAPVDTSGKPITGLVLIGFILNTDGTPIDPVVLQSSNDQLAELARVHVLDLRFQPAKFNSKVVRSLGVQVYNFE